jgi:predicted transcriptional regulator
LKDYRRIDKDPVIDLIRTAFQQTKADINAVAEKAFVRPQTIRNWLNGDTKRPWNITADCVLSVLGVSRNPVWTATGQPVLSNKQLKLIQGGKESA